MRMPVHVKPEYRSGGSPTAATASASAPSITAHHSAGSHSARPGSRMTGAYSRRTVASVRHVSMQTTPSLTPDPPASIVATSVTACSHARLSIALVALHHVSDLLVGKDHRRPDGERSPVRRGENLEHARVERRLVEVVPERERAVVGQQEGLCRAGQARERVLGQLRGAVRRVIHDRHLTRSETRDDVVHGWDRPAQHRKSRRVRRMRVYDGARLWTRDVDGAV